MIYSPGCPVFRSDDGALLEEAFLVEFVTSPAPNAGAIHRNSPSFIGMIEPVLRERVSKVMGLAAHHRCDVMVLGASGYGVFRNDPPAAAGAFRELLAPEGPFWGRFRKALFSMLDTSESLRTYNAFCEHFAAGEAV
ncbi:MAG: TIGR02452 family protein [Anaerolineales bacterium]|nr:TIGR02452 family protein [Anaerolineae bacterium]MCB9132688.1 TIGR02452 family protein [Anaerolineales bacterium]